MKTRKHECTKINIMLLLLLLSISSFGQEKVIKNIILMIPDGTSWATVSSARWYQWYNHPDLPYLNIDPHLCGSVLTFSSNAPIGDSASTTSCYMTGVPSRAGWVATYPVVDPDNDILPLDTSKAYQPLMTLMEAAKIAQNKATGLVVTCEFPHATPADCASHSYNRGKYEWIAPQMVHNDIDVVFGGGTSILNEECKQYLLNEGYELYLDDLAGFRNSTASKMWSLFGTSAMAYDLERDTTQQPSLAEMTATAIEKLSRNENGFFLMVEGSQVDWAAHANEPIAMITEMLAFDKACGIALDFAKKNGETVVIIVPDHGNSGISIGSNHCKVSYGTATKDDLFRNISQYQTTSARLSSIVKKTDPLQLKPVFKQYTGLELSGNEIETIMKCEDYSQSNLSTKERTPGSSLNNTIASILNKNTCFGFTTRGHTGEEVFLAIYDPTNRRPTGFIHNTQLHQYMAKTMEMEGELEHLTNTYFAKHTQVFEGLDYKILPAGGKNTGSTLQVKNKKNTLLIQPNTNLISLNGKTIRLNSVIVYVDRNKTFYLPAGLRSLVQSS